jgi:pectate lyase
MKNYHILPALILAIFAASCTPKVSTVVAQPATHETRAIAFPGAEGFGKYTSGGRGGTIMIVSNLDDNGEGSLRAALDKKIPCTIVFAVSGTIHLEKPLAIYSNVTIAGQSAPGDGICVADQPVVLKGNNIIVRYIRVRMGDRFQNKGLIDGAGSDDAFGGIRNDHVIIDHCSLSWSTDEVFSVYAGDSVTLQWNIISEPLNYSYHFEKGDKDFESHGYGAIWGGQHATFHHNLFAHCNSRTLRFNGIRHTAIENCDFRNNVIYNWGHNNVYAGEGGNYNIVNNFYKYGPDTKKTVLTRVANPFKGDNIPFGKWYVNGNYVEASQDVTNNNWLGVVMEKGTEADARQAKLQAPFPTIDINTEAAFDAYTTVLRLAGASHKRDTLDQRVVKDVTNRTGRIIDVQGGFPHGTAYETTRTAWPFLQSLQPPIDSDSDGIPDEWERKHNLNPNDSFDAVKASLHAFYTNIEVYLNELAR